MKTDNLANEQIYTQERTAQYVWQRAKDVGVSRRRFMQWTAAGTGAMLLFQFPGSGSIRPAVAAHVGPVVKPVPPELFFNYGTNFEMRFEVMADKGYLVPIENFFIRNHTRTPHIDPSTYRLRIHGSGVRRDIELSYDDILRMPMVTEKKYVECAGNGRRLFNLKGGCGQRPGSQWYLGGIGVAEWTGVRLAEVLERAHLKRTAVDVMPAGLDPEFGADGHVRKPHSIEKALHDTLLVVGMNGQTLPADHGFPARILTPGWAGINSIKWVGDIEVADVPLFSAWNTKFYVLENDDSVGCGPGFYPCPPPAVTEQTVKSAFEIAWPTDGVSAEIPADRPVTGRAWSPAAKIKRVEVSVDGGAYHEAELTKPNIPQAWVRLGIDLDLPLGPHVLRCRATDDKGYTQPDSVPCNRQGYLYNAVVTHSVMVV
ncbi:MAG: sulfite oxidase [Nitrospirota bacterium]